MGMMIITANQCRAARAGLGLTREQLGRAAGVSGRTIADFEREAREPLSATKQAIRSALGRFGIRFSCGGYIRLPDNNPDAASTTSMPKSEQSGRPR